MTVHQSTNMCYDLSLKPLTGSDLREIVPGFIVHWGLQLEASFKKMLLYVFD